MESSERKVYCPSCGVSKIEKSVSSFRICESCIEFRDKKYNHSEKDIQSEMQRNIDKTIRRSYR